MGYPSCFGRRDQFTGKTNPNATKADSPNLGTSQCLKWQRLLDARRKKKAKKHKKTAQLGEVGWFERKKKQAAKYLNEKKSKAKKFANEKKNKAKKFAVKKRLGAGAG